MESTATEERLPGMPVPPCSSGGVGRSATSHPRRDALPEHHNYVDVGCFLYPACLLCPQHTCVYEHVFGLQETLTEWRRLLVLRARERKVAWKVIAAFLGLSLRSAYRIGAPLNGGFLCSGEDGGGSLDPLPSTIGRTFPPPL